MNVHELGFRVLRLRREAKLTQRELADLAGLGINTVLRLENGQSIPSLATLDAIAKALHTTSADLMGPQSSAAVA